MGCTSSEPNRIAKDPGFLPLALTGEAGLLLLAWGLGRWLGIPLLQELRPTLQALSWGIAATVPLLLGLALMLAARSGPARRLVSFVVEQIGPLLVRCSVGELAFLAAVAGISEEVLFRGVVQVGLARVLPEVWALLAASMLFGLVHFATRAYAVLAGLMGLYLGSLFLVQGSLLAPIITHGLYDFVALVYVARISRAAQAPLRG
jgi:membrane protease YdiL (CAAX protease family)